MSIEIHFSRIADRPLTLAEQIKKQQARMWNGFNEGLVNACPQEIADTVKKALPDLDLQYSRHILHAMDAIFDELDYDMLPGQGGTPTIAHVVAVEAIPRKAMIVVLKNGKAIRLKESLWYDAMISSIEEDDWFNDCCFASEKVRETLEKDPENAEAKRELAEYEHGYKTMSARRDTFQKRLELALEIERLVEAASPTRR